MPDDIPDLVRHLIYKWAIQAFSVEAIAMLLRRTLKPSGNWLIFSLMLALVWGIGLVLFQPSLSNSGAWASSHEAPKNPCNPCNPAKTGNPCNPCAPKANPCNPCNPAQTKNPCNPGAALVNPCNPGSSSGAVIPVPSAQIPVAANKEKTSWWKRKGRVFSNEPEPPPPVPESRINVPSQSVAMPSKFVVDDSKKLEWGQNYRTWEVVTGYVTSPSHGNRVVQTFINSPAAAEIFRKNAMLVRERKNKGFRPYPPGTQIVQESWTPDPAGGPGSQGPIFLMRKFGEGESAAVGQWHYALTRADFSLIGQGNSGQVSFCKQCHGRAESRDFIFATEF